MGNSLFLKKLLDEYICELNTIEHPVLKEIIAYNRTLENGFMMLDVILVKLLLWVRTLINAKNYLEIGVFTGFSSTAMALSLPPDGRVDALDISVTYSDIAKKFWQKSQVADKIELFLQPALITLKQMTQQGKRDYYDLVLIDADKYVMQEYLEYSYPLVRRGGVIFIDNVLLRGKIVQNNQSKVNTQPVEKPLDSNCKTPKNLARDKTKMSQVVAGVQAFNQKLKADHRFTAVSLPIADDGLTLLIKN